MPLIEFVGPDGDRVEQFHHKLVDETVIDGKKYVRAEIPSRVFSVGHGLQPMTQEQEIKACCYAKEQNQTPWTCKFTKNQIKKIWGI